jgi:hypothetical protein
MQDAPAMRLLLFSGMYALTLVFGGCGGVTSPLPNNAMDSGIESGALGAPTTCPPERPTRGTPCAVVVDECEYPNTTPGGCPLETFRCLGGKWIDETQCNLPANEGDAGSDAKAVEDAAADVATKDAAGPDTGGDAAPKCSGFVQLVVQPGTCLSLACPSGGCTYFEGGMPACGTAKPVPACVNIMNAEATTLSVFASGPLSAVFESACPACH